ncbi:hypothetical protein [Arthrobacter sp. MYb224]|nr:hypothetical protein [Arthrobacter sp. MYb224]
MHHDVHGGLEVLAQQRAELLRIASQGLIENICVLMLNIARHRRL